MVWTYLAESVESQEHSKNGCSLLHTVKSTNTLQPFSCLKCRQVNYLQHQFGTMCVHCQQMNCQKSTSFTEDFPAKTSALLELEKAWKEAEAAYSSRSCDSLMYYDHNSSSWKMCQQSLLEDLLPLPKKLPKEAIIRDGVLYPLVKLAHHTSVKDGGYLPSPVATDATAGAIISKDDTYKMTKNGTLRKYNRQGTNGSIGLARYVQFFPTPTAQRYGSNQGGAQGRTGKVRHSLETMAKKNLWPTPLARDYKDNGKSPSELARSSKTLATHAGGQLNPQWVEWLMGYPVGWTELKDSVMQWYLNARKQRSNTF